MTYEEETLKTLIIHPRRGLFQLTFCQDCGYIFECENCDAKLTTYRAGSRLEMICHQCQSYYSYPNICPKCNSQNIVSRYGGIDDLQEKLAEKNSVYRYGFGKQEGSLKDSLIHLSTRIFDPSINYHQYQNVFIVRAENINASPDYLVQEETAKNITELLLKMKSSSSLILDIPAGYEDIFSYIQPLTQKEVSDNLNLLTHHADFLEDEEKNREAFGFPPYKNLLLITSQEKKPEMAKSKIEEFKKQLQTYQFTEISVTNPYPARFFKRKNMYSYHLLVKYPRQYKDFSSLRSAILSLTDLYRLQVRLNPRHVF